MYTSLRTVGSMDGRPRATTGTWCVSIMHAYLFSYIDGVYAKSTHAQRADPRVWGVTLSAAFIYTWIYL